MIRAQKKAEQLEQAGNDKRKGKKREVEADLTE
jgi:large subunit ribosomal protein L13